MNYNFSVLNEQEFSLFASNHPQASFMQTVELGNLKKEFGNKVHLVGVKEKKQIVAATLLLEEQSFLGYKSFYAPRGYLIDYKDKNLLSYFCTSIEKYIRKNKGFRIIIDPNVIYQIRNSDGSELDKKKNDFLIKTLSNFGYKHFGFNTYMEALQARWEYRLKLDKNYEELKNNYSKSTRKNIDACYKKGLRVRVGSIEDLPTLSEIFESTANRKSFNSRSLSYYQKMHKHMHDLMTIYIAYIDPDIYYECTNSLLLDERKNNADIVHKMETDMVGNKLKNKLETSNALIEKYIQELDKAQKFKEDFPNGKDVGVLLSIKSGDEYLTLSSGILEEYKSFTPKYALYDHHIKDALEQGYKWADFYGITGCFDKNDKYYGIYEFKKGFGGNVVELVGQFEKSLSPVAHIYNGLKKLKHIIKR